jgi:CDP-glucose 4,6-dehydratase
MLFDLSFYKNKKILITGHTGFKGTWLTKMLLLSGAEVTGYSIEPPTDPSLFEISGVGKNIRHIIGDIRDYEHLLEVFGEVEPEIVFHLAAQPIVRDSYKEPKYTYETNVMGTVNIMECVRLTPCVKSVVNVTTDKVYYNEERESGYKEDEKLDGYDPYSNSKSCSELVTHSYRSSFFKEGEYPAISTARAGNVIGGGDFANDRIIPDCVRAAKKGEDIIVRNPYSTRPYQHVLEPVTAYLMIVKAQYEDPTLASWFNVGPDDCDCVTTGDIVNMFCTKWGNIKRVDRIDPNAPHEANFLKLDSSKLKKTFGWKPTWHIDETIDRICEWNRVWFADGDIPAIMDKQIADFLK